MDHHHDHDHQKLLDASRALENAKLQSLEGVDHVKGEEDPVKSPHDEIGTKFDKKDEEEFFRRRDESMYPQSRNRVQGRRGKEPRKKHLKGGNIV